MKSSVFGISRKLLCMVLRESPHVFGCSPSLGLVKQGQKLEVCVIEHLLSFRDVFHHGPEFGHLEGFVHGWINPSRVIFLCTYVTNVPFSDVACTAIVKGFQNLLDLIIDDPCFCSIEQYGRHNNQIHMAFVGHRGSLLFQNAREHSPFLFGLRQVSQTHLEVVVCRGELTCQVSEAVHLLNFHAFNIKGGEVA